MKNILFYLAGLTSLLMAQEKQFIDCNNNKEFCKTIIDSSRTYVDSKEKIEQIIDSLDVEEVELFKNGSFETYEGQIIPIEDFNLSKFKPYEYSGMRIEYQPTFLNRTLEWSLGTFGLLMIFGGFELYNSVYQGKYDYKKVLIVSGVLSGITMPFVFFSDDDLYIGFRTKF